MLRLGLMPFNDSMERSLERYERYSYAERQLVATDSESQGSWTLEFPKLLARTEVLQRNIRHFLGDDLDPLSLRELQNLEQQLDIGLKRIRTRKNQLMHESIMELQKKEKALQEQNNLLAKKLKENEKTVGEHSSREQPSIVQNKSTFMLSPPQQPPPSTLALPSLSIGGPFQSTAVNEDGGARTRPGGTGLMPPWMLRHADE
ncbi:hypothetical protein CJ030_MR6G021385 [Morella rubra]|uniref:K-box domain-containing protein n=1 Tax=Morella rubra TaxID=262757 RepID=A0A6A1VFT5_9ROSI|nr:hypothetical protein CJ030_MR6G021385 [Morella rubra]